MTAYSIPVHTDILHYGAPALHAPLGKTLEGRLRANSHSAQRRVLTPGGLRLFNL